MSKHDDKGIPQPSALPENPSVGELRTEIDRARHDAAHTVTALTKKLDTAVSQAPTTVATAVGTSARQAIRPSVLVWFGCAVVLVIWWRRRQHR